MPGAFHPVPPSSLPGDIPMLTRIVIALGRFEDSPAGHVLGLVVLFALALSPLALNEAGVR